MSVALPCSVRPRRTSAAIFGSSSTTNTFMGKLCLGRHERDVNGCLRGACASHICFTTGSYRGQRMSDSHPTRRRNDMRTRLTKLAAALAAIAALAVGGSALASAGSKANPPTPPTQAAAAQSGQETASSVDTDNVQQGDQSAPDSSHPAAETAAEQAGSESEQAGEAGPSDGPGGYADTNPNADTQQQGEH